MTSPRFVVAGLLMLVAAGATLALTPVRKMADTGSRVQLERAIPTAFGDWQVDPSIVPLSVDPELQANLNRIYNQTLSRTYVNDKGERIMLSIAYGGDQLGDMQVHRPEVCYPAQGFQVLSNRDGFLDTPFGKIPVRRLETRAISRWEPVTYWITIGDRAVVNMTERRLAAFAYGLRGTVPDGMLFRVSSIDRDSARAFAAQAEFVHQLLQALDNATRIRVAGVEPQ